MGFLDEIQQNPDLWLKLLSTVAPGNYRPVLRLASNVVGMSQAGQRQEDWLKSYEKVMESEAARRSGKAIPGGQRPSAEDLNRAKGSPPQSARDTGLQTAVQAGSDFEEMRMMQRRRDQETMQRLMAFMSQPATVTPARPMPSKQQSSLDILAKILAGFGQRNASYSLR